MKWVGNEKNILLLLKQLHDMFALKPLVLWKLIHFSDMQMML